MKIFENNKRLHNENINFENKKVIPSTNESYKKTKIYYMNKKRFVHKYTSYKIYCKVRKHCHCTSKYRGVAHTICNLKYSIPKEIPVIF